ncbi:hypothetical protein LguiB_009604 [Lonicera macranthoides]
MPERKIRRVRNKYTNAIKGGKKNNPMTMNDVVVEETLSNGSEEGEATTQNEAVVKENSKFITIANDYLSKIMAIGGNVRIPGIDLGVFEEGMGEYFAKKLKTLMLKEFELYSEKVELVSIVVKVLKSK